MTELQTINELLDANKDRHDAVLIIGFDKIGKIHIDTNRPTFEFVNYAANRCIYNINHLETAQVIQNDHQPSEIAPPANAAEVAVAQAVANNTAPPKKRGRPKKTV